MSEKPRNVFVPIHPDPDHVLAGDAAAAFTPLPPVTSVPEVDNPPTLLWEDGDGTLITEDPHAFLLLIDF
jgi:hypothetical protein